MVDNKVRNAAQNALRNATQNKQPIKVSKKNLKIQGNIPFNTLIIIVVVLTVLGFLVTIVLDPGSIGESATSVDARSVSNTNTYPYTQAATPYVQPTYTQQSYTQPTVQSRSNFNTSVADINAASAVAGTGIAYGAIQQQQATIQPTIQPTGNYQLTPPAIPQPVSQPIPQVTGQLQGIASNGQIIGLRAIQPIATPYIPTTAPNTTVIGRTAMTPESNPTTPYTVGGNAVLTIDTVQAYRPQNQELIMNQACINEVWQRNPYVIRNFSNLSVRLSATNPTANGNMRTYSFNLDNRPTGNGALCTVTTDGYVTAVSFY